MSSQSSWERLKVIDAIVIALVGGFLGGIAVTVGYVETMAGLFVLGPLVLVITLAGAYVRLEGVPDRDELTNPRTLLEDVLTKRRD